MVSSLPSSVALVEYFRKSHAVPRFLHEAYMAMFLASLKVGTWSPWLPAVVGTGTTPQSTLP